MPKVRFRNGPMDGEEMEITQENFDRGEVLFTPPIPPLVILPKVLHHKRNARPMSIGVYQRNRQARK